jgi:hypothetical protein
MIQLPDVAPPPYDQEAEHAVLGSTQLDREAIAHVRGLLRPEDYYHEENPAGSSRNGDRAGRARPGFSDYARGTA